MIAAVQPDLIPISAGGGTGAVRSAGSPQQLRCYQKQAIADTLKAWQVHRSVIGVAATGLGKTTIMAELVRQCRFRTLFLAHREELVYQAVERFEQFGLTTGIEMAGYSVPRLMLGLPNVVVATPQTLYACDYKRMRELKPAWFDLLLIDECHHYVSPAYRKIIEFYKTSNPTLRILGVTATPDRHDNIAMRNIFDGVAFKVDIRAGIELGYLVPIQQLYVRVTGLDYSTVRVVGGDLSHVDVANILEQERNVIAFANAIVECAGNKQTLVFTESVKQAELLAGLINVHKPGSAVWLHCGSRREDRADWVARFKRKEVQFMVNCALFLEGFDCPNIECVAMAKPTQSRALYAQMLGRGTRPLDGLLNRLQDGTAEQRRRAIAESAKPNLTVLDFIGNSGRHKLITAVDVLAGEQISEQAKERAKARLLANEKKALDIETILAEAEAQEKALVAARSHYTVTYVDPFDAFTKRQEKWKNHVQRRASKKQIAFLERQGYNIRGLSQEEIIGLWERVWWERYGATKRQLAVLERFYPKADFSRLTRWEAHDMISALAKNKWKPISKPISKEQG